MLVRKLCAIKYMSRKSILQGWFFQLPGQRGAAIRQVYFIYLNHTRPLLSLAQGTTLELDFTIVE